MRIRNSSFLLSTLLAIGIFLASEVGLRILTSSSSRWNVRVGASKQFDPDLGFRNKPHYTIAPGVETNEFGYLAPLNLRKERPGDRLRVIYLGDSNSVTPGVENYPYLLERLLEDQLAVDVETVNAAVPGYSSLNARLLFEKELSRFDAHHFVVYLGWNDLGQFGPEGLPYKRHDQGYEISPVQKALTEVYSVRLLFALGHVLRRMSPTTNHPMSPEDEALYAAYRPVHFVENMHAILRLAKERYPHVHVMNLATITSDDPTEDEMRRAHFPTGMDKNIKKLHVLVRKYSEAVDQVARDQGLEVIDLFSLFDDRDARRHFTDSCHMNREGTALIASAAAESILRAEGAASSAVTRRLDPGQE